MNSRDKALQLYYENEKLAYWLVHRYFPDLDTDEDILQEARIGLWKACLNYDESVGTLSALATRCVKTQVLMKLRNKKLKSNPEEMCISLETLIPDTKGETLTIGDSLDDFKAEIDNQDLLVTEFISKLKGKKKNIVLCRIYGLNQKETAEVLHTTRAYVCKLIGDMHKQYKEEYNE